MGARSAAASFREGLRIGQRAKEFDVMQGLRERGFEEEQRRFEVGQEQREEDISRRGLHRSEDIERSDRYRKEDKEQRDKEYKEDIRRFDEEMNLRKSTAGRDKTRFKWEKEDRAEKDRYKVLEKKFETAKAYADVGDQEMAGKLMVDLYNEEWPTDDEARVIFKSMSPDDPIWQKPEFKANELVVMTKQSGVLPVKNIKEFMKLTSGVTNYKEYSKDLKEATTRLTAKNDAEKPFQAKDGKFYKQMWKLQGGQVVKDGEPVEYQGPTALAGGEKKAAEAGLDVSKLDEDTKEILAGVKQQKPQDVPGDTNKAMKAETDRMKSDVTQLLRYFTEEGAILKIDNEGNLSKAGDSALAKARNLLKKHKADPASVPPGDLGLVGYARDAINAYNVMQQNIMSRYGSAEAGDDMLGKYDF